MTHAARLTALTVLLLALVGAPRATEACSPRNSILPSPRVGSDDVQAKALNDRGDVVGFADGRDGTYRAILWKRGNTARPVDLGVLPGYVSSEAYGVNNRRVVFGLLYDKRERTFPFRWQAGRMTVLRDPRGRIRQAAIPDRNTINERGEMTATLLIAGDHRAVRWTPDGKATFLSPLPGHTWTNAWSIGPDGVVSGWSRRLPNDDGENNPVIWTRSGRAIALQTAPGRADGAAEATNRSGLTVGYLGNLGTDQDPESDQAAVWPRRGAAPLLIGPADPYAYTELVDVNDRGQAIGMSGTFTEDLFPVARPAVWRRGWRHLRVIPIPARARRAHPVVVAQLNDINSRGDVVGNAYGLAAEAYDALSRVYPVRWTCPFGQ
jgi:probable HAF family extracellular repeat protein